MTGTLSIVELIWIIISLVASVFAARGVWRWRREDRQRKTDGLNGPLAVFYRGKIRLFSLGLTAFILCLLLGIQSALLPPRTQPLQAGYQTVLAKTLIYTAPLVIIVVIALFALALILDDRDRTLTDRAHDKKAEQRLLAIETAAKIAAERADATNAKADAAFTRADVAEQRADVAEQRADVAEQRADVAEQRADVAEQRADTAVYTVEGLTPRVDSAEGELGVHTGEITDHTDRLDVLEGTKERADG
jgi:hypothetical protein